MKNLVLILFMVFAFCGCKKEEKPVEKSKYLVLITTGIYDTRTDVTPNCKLSGTDIETKDNLGPVNSFYDFDLPKGKSTTIKLTLTQGTSGVVMAIYKERDDHRVSDENKIFDGSDAKEVSATFTVQ